MPGHCRMQDELSRIGKLVHKDSHWDLARIKRWRWRDRFGLKALTGSSVFVARKYPQMENGRPKHPFSSPPAV